jgi:hypothetical protein
MYTYYKLIFYETVSFTFACSFCVGFLIHNNASKDYFYHQHVCFYTLFIQKLALSRTVVDELTNQQKLAERGVAKVQQLLTTDFNSRIFPLLKASGAENFKQ